MEVSELLLASIGAVSGAVNILSASVLPMPCLRRGSYIRQSRAGYWGEHRPHSVRDSHCPAVVPLSVALLVCAESAASSVKGLRREGRGDAGVQETTSQVYGETNICHPGSGLLLCAVLSYLYTTLQKVNQQHPRVGLEREGRGAAGFQETTSQLYGETDSWHIGSGAASLRSYIQPI